MTEQDTRGQYALTPGLAFHWWEQLALLLICLIPLAHSFLVREPRAVESTRAEGSAPDPSTDAAAESRAQVGLGDMDDRRRVILIGAVVLAIIASVAVVTFTTTNAALTARVTNTANTAGTRLTCRGALTSVGASSSVFAFALVPTGIAARTETDLAGNTTGTYKVAPVPHLSRRVHAGRPLTAVTFSSSTAQCLSSTAASSPALSTFSLEAWFRTNTTTAPTAGFGKIIGFGGSANSPIESSYDRHVYLNASGQVVFGTYQDGYRTINSSSSKADQAWHHVMATFSAATGMILYVDGVVAASNTSYATAESTAGYWKVGWAPQRWPFWGTTLPVVASPTARGISTARSSMRRCSSGCSPRARCKRITRLVTVRRQFDQRTTIAPKPSRASHSRPTLAPVAGSTRVAGLRRGRVSRLQFAAESGDKERGVGPKSSAPLSNPVLKGAPDAGHDHLVGGPACRSSRPYFTAPSNSR